MKKYISVGKTYYSKEIIGSKCKNVLIVGLKTVLIDDKWFVEYDDNEIGMGDIKARILNTNLCFNSQDKTVYDLNDYSRCRYCGGCHLRSQPHICLFEKCKGGAVETRFPTCLGRMKLDPSLTIFRRNGYIWLLVTKEERTYDSLVHAKMEKLRESIVRAAKTRELIDTDFYKG